jgi:hypothetical protein
MLNVSTLKTTSTAGPIMVGVREKYILIHIIVHII